METRQRDVPDWYESLKWAPERVARRIDEYRARPWYYPSQVGGSLLVGMLALTWTLAVVPLAGLERVYTTDPGDRPVTWLFGVFEVLVGVAEAPLALVVAAGSAALAGFCFLASLVVWLPVAVVRRVAGREPATVDESTDDEWPDVWTVHYHWEYGEGRVRDLLAATAGRCRDHRTAGRYGRCLGRFVLGVLVVVLATAAYGLAAVVFVVGHLFFLGLTGAVVGLGWGAVVGHPLIDPAARAMVVLPVAVAALSLGGRFVAALRG